MRMEFLHPAMWHMWLWNHDSNIQKVWWEILYGFCWKITWLSSSERILKIR